MLAERDLQLGRNYDLLVLNTANPVDKRPRAPRNVVNMSLIHTSKHAIQVLKGV